ncbi:YrpD family protein [Dehalobacterium formicoaceticum]|uniref:Uncharacterized protein n=1 Tax=Dehalobacterium formicoaceticum TaxID=51515 RepID=A0ABT1Y6S7_9FIRM|nr:YrpD family protein [Dehalobacterium formicoaceticum]MCR6546590.1 hypothetical protein [Dehalobacterium formicoaceticum]
MKKLKILLAISLLCLSTFSISVFAVSTEPVESLKGTNGKTVKVIHQESVKVSDSILEMMLKNAKDAIAEEKSKTNQAEKNASNNGTTYDYVTFDEDNYYFYEESLNSDPELIVYDIDQQDIAVQVQSFDSTITPMATQTDFISDGVGGKQKVTKTGTSGSYLSTQMTLPTSSQVSTDLTKYAPYNYGGFEYTLSGNNGIGSWAADMGLQLYNNLGPQSNASGWKPLIVLKKKIGIDSWQQYSIIFPDTLHQEGQYHNGYKPGSAPVMYFWYNYNGKVRMKVDGTTICPTRHGTTLADTHNITIMESSSSCNLSQITTWKLLSTVVSTDNTGKNKAVFSNIKVDGVAVSSTYFPTPEQDHASVTRSSNNVTIVVDSSIYQF